MGSLCDSLIIQFAFILISVMCAVLISNIYNTGCLPSKSIFVSTIIVGIVIKLICYVMPSATIDNRVIMCIAAKETLVDKALALPEDLTSIPRKDLFRYSKAMGDQYKSLLIRLESIEGHLTSPDLRMEFATKIETFIQLERSRERIVTHMKGGIPSDSVTYAKRFVSIMAEVDVNPDPVANSNQSSSSNANNG